MEQPSDNATPVGAIAELQREAEGFKQVAEGMLVWAEALMKKVHELEQVKDTEADEHATAEV